MNPNDASRVANTKACMKEKTGQNMNLMIIYQKSFRITMQNQVVYSTVNQNRQVRSVFLYLILGKL
jgi:hypothetical protein